MKRAMWLSAMVVGLSAVVGGSSTAAPPVKAPPPKVDEPLKPNAALKPKLDKRIAPFAWGMTSEKVFAELEKNIDAAYADKIAKAYNPKAQDALEKKAAKEKKDLRSKLIVFSGGSGVSGYEVKAKGEFTYKNGESAIEVSRPGGGERQLFFINDSLYKVYDQVMLTGKDSELGEKWEDAIERTTKDLGEKGKIIPKGTPNPSYYGTLIAIPELVLWSDGKTQLRLIDHTKREDLTTKTVGIAYEDLGTIANLPAKRTNVEKKTSDVAVDKAGQPDVPPPKPKDPKKK